MGFWGVRAEVGQDGTEVRRGGVPSATQTWGVQDHRALPSGLLCWAVLPEALGGVLPSLRGLAKDPALPKESRKESFVPTCELSKARGHEMGGTRLSGGARRCPDPGLRVLSVALRGAAERGSSASRLPRNVWTREDAGTPAAASCQGV